MRLLLDENLPIGLVSHLARDHVVDHVVSLGWSGVKNGDLLERAAGSYDALITGDTNMSNQQNLARFDLAIILLRPRRQVLSQLVALVPPLLRALPTAPRRTLTVIDESSAS